MSHRKLARAAVAVVVAVMAACLFEDEAAAADDPGFESVFPSVYADLLHDSKVAYEAKRYEEAFPMMQKLACAGDKESQWMIGHMFLLGQGVARDDLTGYAWIKVAAEFNSHEYHAAVEKIEKAIDPKQLPDVQAAVRPFVDKYGIRATNMSCNLAASQHGHIMDRIICTPKDDGQFDLLRRCAAPKPAQAATQAKTTTTPQK